MSPNLLVFYLLMPARLANQGVQADINQAAQRMKPRLVELRRDFHAHPELSNREQRTSRVVAERLRALVAGVKGMTTLVLDYLERTSSTAPIQTK